MRSRLCSPAVTRLLLWCALALFACKEEPPAPPPAPPSQPEPKQASSQPEKKNELAYKDSRCSGAEPCVCVGHVEFGLTALSKIGITDEDLANGALCLLGDFDGNGHQDAAFVEKEYGKAPAVSVVVLLFDEVGVRDIPLFPKKVATLGVFTKDEHVGLIENGSRLFFTYEGGKFEMKRI